MSSDIERARTYRNYVHAYSVCFQHMGCTNDAAIAERHSALLWSQVAQPNGMSSNALRTHLFRGWLTLDTLEGLPLDEHPDLAIGAAMWLPVQAYYACHGLGLAALYAMGAQMPAPAELTHRKFLNMACVNMVQPGALLPPCDLRCSGDCTCEGGEHFHGSEVAPQDVAATHNLSTPATPGHAELLIAKALKTTRREVLRQKQQQRRHQLGRKRLTNAVKQAICSDTTHTTCFDFLYRMRICSNYEDADMFLFGQGQNDALEHCRRVTRIARVVCMQLECVIRRKLGPIPYDQLKAQYAGHHQA